ncbi:excinuclease ABC subunit A, partial [Enterococcus gallinarum]
RHVGITYSKLIYTSSIQLDLFADAEEQIKQIKLDKIIDKIREKYGFTSSFDNFSFFVNPSPISK